MKRAINLIIPVIAVLAVAWPRTSSALEIKRLKLDNGAVLLVSAQHQLPMVSMVIAFDAGARRDPAGKEGLAALTAAALEQGARDLSAGDFDQKVDFMGSSIGISADHDWAIANMTSLKKYSDTTLHLLAQLLVNPGLRDSDISRKQADLVAEIKAEQEEPGYTAEVAFIKEVFGDTPYGHPANGYAYTVAKLTPQDVRGFYQQFYKAGSAVIAVTGDVDANRIKTALDKELAGIPGAVPAQNFTVAPPVPPGLHLKAIDRKVAQANIIAGSMGIARSNPDYYKIQVMNYILGGGGFASRLTKVVRSKAGLAYTVGSGFQASRYPGAFVVMLQTKNQSANEAIKLVLEQMREIRERPVSAAELESAKKYLIGSFPLKLDRQSEIANFMLQIELNNLGLDYADRYPKLIQAVTVADVQEVARKYLHPEALDVVAVADQGEAKLTPESIVTDSKSAAAAAQ